MQPEALMRLLAQVPRSEAGFEETRFMSMLSEPLKLSGTLSYVRPDHLEKSVRSPYRERLTVTGDRLSLEAGAASEPRVLSLSEQPLLRALVEGVRATLAGDLASLERHYRVTLEGTLGHWVLSLHPRLAETQALLAWVRIDGQRERIIGLEVQEASGDRSVMRIVTRSP
ncbi:MAG: LolA-related protein [Gammaproteobacteria bacterium]